MFVKETFQSVAYWCYLRNLYAIENIPTTTATTTTSSSASPSSLFHICHFCSGNSGGDDGIINDGRNDDDDEVLLLVDNCDDGATSTSNNNVVSVMNGINIVKPSYIMVTFFKDVHERNQYIYEIEKIEKEMRFFLETEDMVEMKDTGVLSYEDLLLLLDFVFCMVSTSKDFYYRLGFVFCHAYEKRMKAHEKKNINQSLNESIKS